MTENLHPRNQISVSTENRRRFRCWLWLLLGATVLLTVVVAVELADNMLLQHRASPLSGAPIAFSPDGHILAAGSTTGKQIRVLEKASGDYQTSAMKELAFSPDGRWLAGLGNDNIIRIWNGATGRLVHTFGGYLSQVNTLAFSPDSRVLITGSGYTTFHFWTTCTIRIWNVQSGVSIQEPLSLRAYT